MVGVAGSGKTRIGRLLAEKLECDFLEGDRRHPALNIAKMLAQAPLTDGDRTDWLEAMVADVQRAVDGRYETVMTCSALKLAYRKKLRLNDRVQLVWIRVSEAELQHRLTQRESHYLSPQMLQSQLDTFEPIESSEQAIVVDGMQAPREIVDDILAQVQRQCPSIAQPWWER
ncbi:AAA family ATPase [filamentous cyanobacterium LEGE 11480]|uniref:Gluconokinase n=1 Tax=Romeriopsis navalis LEGE 11480 TaxID=2777977 RepID=A0A928VVN1_9CYAN|nr:AAA family ATPase [Romeriopsis navalis LEGE 11480]